MKPSPRDDSATDQMIVLSVCADPKPMNLVSITNAKRPVVARHADRPQVRVESLELERGMPWIVLPQPVLLSRLIPNGLRKPGVEAPILRGRQRLHPSAGCCGFRSPTALPSSSDRADPPPRPTRFDDPTRPTSGRKIGSTTPTVGHPAVAESRTPIFERQAWRKSMLPSVNCQAVLRHS